MPDEAIPQTVQGSDDLKDVGVIVAPDDVVNEILPFCAQGQVGRDLLSQADYAQDMQRNIGHQPGIARSMLANKHARQTAHMAAGLAQFIARRYAPGIKDDGNLDALEAALCAAILRVATNDNFPIGGIIAFSGTFGGTDNRFPIPLGGSAPDTNWVLCDGTQTNGLAVPDLRGRMILGASDAHQAGDTGGSETHEHSLSGTVGMTTITTEQMPAHNHNITRSNGGSGNDQIGNGPNPAGRTNTTGFSGSNQPHTHSLTVSISAANSLPPYYALAYIMRCA